MPGGIASDAKARGVQLRDLAQIPSETLLVTVIGDRDARAADLAARRLLREASAVPPERKLFLRALSDDHGFPALTATLTSPAAFDAAFDAGAIKLPPEPPRDPKQPPPPFKLQARPFIDGPMSTGRTICRSFRSRQEGAHPPPIDTAGAAMRDATRRRNRREPDEVLERVL